MNRVIAAAVLSTSVMGCNAIDTSVIIQGVVPPELGMGGGCTFKPSDEFVSNIVLDTAGSFQLLLPLAVENRQPAIEDDLGSPSTPQVIPFPSDWTPLRFELRWECDSNGFTSNLGALIVPAFHPSLPFCLDKRADANQEFVGFDVVPAEGGAIAPEEIGVAVIRPVPFQLGQAINDTFRIAVLADECCRLANTNCDGSDQTPGNSCKTLQDIFATIDPMNLSVSSGKAQQPSEDLLTFRGFSVFDGSYAARTNSTPDQPLIGAFYPMRLRGTLEGMNGDGSLVTSSEIGQQVGFCRTCGQINQRMMIPPSRVVFSTDPTPAGLGSLPGNACLWQ